MTEVIAINPRALTLRHAYLARSIRELQEAVRDVPAGFSTVILAGFGGDVSWGDFATGFLLGVVSRNPPGHLARGPDLGRFTRAEKQFENDLILSELCRQGKVKMSIKNGELMLQLVRTELEDGAQK